jgi:hypothetical protein
MKKRSRAIAPYRIRGKGVIRCLRVMAANFGRSNVKRTYSAIAGTILVVVCASDLLAEEPWRKHVIHEGLHTNTAVAGDFTKDGKPDIISNSGSKMRLIVAPDGREVILAERYGHDSGIRSRFPCSERRRRVP